MIMLQTVQSLVIIVNEIQSFLICLHHQNPLEIDCAFLITIYSIKLLYFLLYCSLSTNQIHIQSMRGMIFFKIHDTKPMRSSNCHQLNQSSPTPISFYVLMLLRDKLDM